MEAQTAEKCGGCSRRKEAFRYKGRWTESFGPEMHPKEDLWGRGITSSV
jgi:hypothetical protein